MDSRTQERVEQWDSRPFSGGYDGLTDLANSDFSGAVAVAGSWLFLLNGRIVGVIDGTLEDFEAGSGTVYEAPDPSLPLLCTMEVRGGETRAKYYTNDTPLREVDQTLQNGSFTGYIELSENVLSGDYYAVYYGGRRLAAAYIGTAERLITGDDAFERAADEVGIYRVIDVEIDVTDVPSSGDTDTGSDAIETGQQSAADAPSTTTAGTETDVSVSFDETAVDSTDITDAEETGSGIATGESESDRSSGGSTETSAESVDTSAEAHETADPTQAEQSEDAESASSSVGDRTVTQETEEADAVSSIDGSDEQSVSAQTASSTDAVSTAADADATADSTSPDHASSAPHDPEERDEMTGEPDQPDADGTDTVSAHDDRPSDEPGTDGDEHGERFEQEEQWREARSIPSIDPDDSEEIAPTTHDNRSAVDRTPDSASQQPPQSGAAHDRSDHQQSTQTGHTRATDHGQGASNTASQPAEHEVQQTELNQRLERLREQRDTLWSKVEDLESERDELHSKNQELLSTIERLQSRVNELETKLEQVQEADGAEREQTASRQLPRKQALSQTNLFVRYGSKSQPTLETAHEGSSDRDEVASNLRLGYHTQFDETDTTVDGEPYETVLTASIEYQFVNWLIGALLYEIRDTGHADALGGLYDAIPQIDRIELQAPISLEDDETEDVPDEVVFDLVAYDKMGNPLLITNLNDSRKPASQEMLKGMERAASAVKANYPDLAAAVVVTSSYFEPGALEVVEQATGSGFLSRSSNLSYVNLSRKHGYHLCLVESRSEGFYMNVPEL